MSTKSLRLGREFEKTVLKRLQDFLTPKARLQPASGSKSRKGDIHAGDFIVECKATNNKSYRLDAETLNKIRNDAAAHGKMPLLVVRLKDGRTYWVVEDPIMMDLLSDQDGFGIE